MIKHKNLRNKRRKVRRFKFDFEYTPISNIPVEYQIYIKAHRHFEATVAKYELLLENLIFAESLFEWIREIKCCIEEVEHQIHPHCQNSCHPHPNNPNGGKGDNHGTIQCRTQTSNIKQTAIA